MVDLGYFELLSFDLINKKIWLVGKIFGSIHQNWKSLQDI